jgi:transcriptional regulator with XRE-family HTH domain
MGKRTRIVREAQPTLRAWRERLRLSRQQVATMMDARWPDLAPTDQATIAKWESGESSVRLTDLKLLAEIYGTTPDRLMFDPGDTATPDLMQAAHKILTTKDRAALAAWLASGEFLPDAKPTKKES